MIVLGIETSCDETGVALYSEADGLLGHLYHSQIALHQPYGGVVPEIASRDHVQKLVPLVESLLEKTHMGVTDIHGVAYTAGPGLAGALLVGAAFARSFAFAREIPAVGIHHLEGHLLSPFLEKDTPEFPFLALLVSGGHTLLIEVSALGVYKIRGHSIDDAAGEAFDKTARLLGLPYPGGAALSALAVSGDPAAYAFPRPMPHSLNFSFSGLKTAVAQQISKETLNEQTRANIAASFQAAVVDSLIHKSLQALKETGLKQLVVSGGVSANQSLRLRLTQDAAALGAKVFYPALEFCTDNGAMIAYAGYKRLQQGQTNNLDFSIKARWSLEGV